ncbi:MAG: S8 family serine peptidase [Acidimicrobiia bacterium]|nr:S8 family serine peptidase [Acidimicrobiia bacterium]
MTTDSARPSFPDPTAGGGTTDGDGNGSPPARSPAPPPPGVVLTLSGPGEAAALTRTLADRVGLSEVASSADLGGGPRGHAEPEVMVLEALGVAVIHGDPDQLGSLSVAARTGELGVMAAEPELVLHALGATTLPTSPPLDAYLRGFHDGVSALVAAVAAPTGALDGADQASGEVDDDELTWGLRAVGAHDPAAGAGVTVAVLDTGVATAHPDLCGRARATASFVPGESVEDANGHGTHCVGTVAGPASPTSGPRYGVAPEVELLVGKVLSDGGSGNEGWILAGIDWALRNGAHVVSLSLGADVATPRVTYEVVGQRALERGSLLVAAAGNNARRSHGRPGFVGTPANASTVLAVAAVDPRLAVADFSARSGHACGARVDVAAPGVAVRSAWPHPPGYLATNGTSMATPHVAGLAACWAQHGGHHGSELWRRLTCTASPLDVSAADVGAGLAVAPQAG